VVFGISFSKAYADRKRIKYLRLMAEKVQYMTQIDELWLAHVSLSISKISFLCKLYEKYLSRSFPAKAITN